MDQKTQKPTENRLAFMTRHKILALAGNILLGVALAIAVYLIADIWLFNRAPAGTCPLTANRPWIWLAVGLSVLSLILSFFEPKKEQ